tara:strand:- start:755 stop:2476 length:1722 start_codon:yes stop_codon:yes gene_type:complete
MTPICLLNNYKIIFICAARHVGLTLANYMITMGKKVAFAFGCSEIEDIRLHFNAISEYNEIKTKKGIIKKPDHSNGEKVEIIISDLQSYYYSMLYMLSFNDKQNMILYWDEPTIALDYKEHPLHSNIKNIMKINKIPNLILSSASLPNISNVKPLIDNYKNKFACLNVDIIEIKSHINQNSVSIYDDCGNTLMPHYLWLNVKYENKLKNFIENLSQRKDLQKYLNIFDCINFINDVKRLLNIDVLNHNYVKENILPEEFVMIENKHITQIYLYLISILNRDKKDMLCNHYDTKYQIKKLKNQQVYLTSKDSFTITGGPCLYLTNKSQKLIQMLFKTSQIPEDIIHALLKIVENNATYISIINKNVKLFEDAMKDEFEKEKKMEAGKLTHQAEKIKNLIDTTKKKLKSVSLNEEYIPNYKQHFEKFHETLSYSDYDLWSSQIDEVKLEEILMIEDLEPIFKLTLMIGIGVLHNDLPKKYNEQVKELSIEQKLFMVIADEDYIYGTNYQFCHGYLGKDLSNITQEKLIQSMGRIGRQNMNKKYSFRLRDNSLIEKIYLKNENHIEIDNMNRLFTD